MNELLFGPWEPLLAYTGHHPWRMFANALVLAQLGVLVMYMMFGGKGSSRGDSGGDIGGWDFGDGDSGGSGD
jgi:uncharacterized membrane protein YgcG